MENKGFYTDWQKVDNKKEVRAKIMNMTGWKKSTFNSKLYGVRKLKPCERFVLSLIFESHL